MSKISRHNAGTVVAGEKTGGRFKAHEREAATFPVVETGTHPLDQHFDSLDEKIAVMSEEVQARVEALKDDENWNAYLNTMSKFHNYSLSNQLLIALQKPDATRVGGKTLWKSLGRELKPYPERGRGIAIFRPKTGWRNKVDKDGNEVIGPDGKPVRERAVFGYSTTTIYDISQTTGDPLPDIQRELTEEPPEGFIEDLETAITDLGYELRYEEIPGSAGGYTQAPKNGRKGLVVVDSSHNPGSRARVLAHELGHIAAGHTSDDETRSYHTGAGGSRGAMEVEAESISHVLLRMNGMKTAGDVSGTYVAGWSKAQVDDPNVVKNSAAAVQKSVKELISSRKWRNVPGSGPQEKPAYVRRSKKK